MSKIIPLGSAAKGYITIKVKYQKNTCYIECQSKDTISIIKLKVQEYLDVIPNHRTGTFELFKVDIKEPIGSSVPSPLDDEQTIGKLELKDSNSLILSYVVNGEIEPLDFEIPALPEMDEYESEDDNDMH